ncbi:AMP-dependent synthetase/ligase [Sediminitomix flava]|uniref:Long-chain acyl-CoA synthetase n=1 Tax=Sediminitomix flava TaxID=379075 RepID=A0A315YY70_SEDFL|nr:long-chain fatty acid--CoA ligase [Sediminitomix flava]PWJ33656.1 long-chain acyl-CoA synthetase [Sediminitomix flava]
MQQPTRLFDFLHYQKENCPQEKAFGHKYKGEWVHFSTDEAIEIANKVSRGLIKMGVKAGDKVGLVIYQNRPEWVFMDMGISQIGAINVPMYPTISSSDYNYILNDAEVSYCFVGRDDLYDKVAAVKDQVPSLKEIYTFDEQEGRKFWKEIFSDEGQEEVEQRMAAVKEEDLATLIYTSGTTGLPKGVMLSHKNIASNALSVKEIPPLAEGKRILSFLPLCHIFERTCTYFSIVLGLNITYTSTDNLGGEDGDIRAVRPHFFTTVPRLLEKVYEKIYNKGLELGGIKRGLFFWALRLTEDYEIGKEYTGLAKIKRNIADKLIFSKWREALGGEVLGILSGAAPLPAKIAQVFNAAGIMVREGYGLTETSPGLTIGLFNEQGARLGSIGPAIRGVEVAIDEDPQNYGAGEGEVIATGPNIMMGYYNREDATNEVIFEKDGKRWFRTGDIGKLVDGPNGQKFLKITDRKKELLKTSGGKYVAPAPIESKFKEDFNVEQMMVVGEGKKFVSALIVPNEEALHAWCNHKHVPFNSLEEAIKHPKVIDKYQRIVDGLNPQFSKIEQVKKFVLISEQWEAEKADGSEAELTPTMKMKRRVIRKKYKDVIDGIYGVTEEQEQQA